VQKNNSVGVNQLNYFLPKPTVVATYRAVATKASATANRPAVMPVLVVARVAHAWVSAWVPAVMSAKAFGKF